jgi:hypothetical protein
MAPALIVVLLLGLAGSARETTPAALPPDLPAAERARLSEVTERASVSARSGGEPFRVRRDLFEYLLDHPELASHIIQALKVNRFRIWREPDGLWLDDRAGALVRFQIAYSAPGSRVFFMQGRYQPTVLPAIHGRVVAIIEYTVEPADRGRSLITPAMASFVRIDNAVYGVLARLFTAVIAPRATRVTNRIVVDIVRTARAIDSDPDAVDAALRERPDVPADELAEFRRLLAGRRASRGHALVRQPAVAPVPGGRRGESVEQIDARREAEPLAGLLDAEDPARGHELGESCPIDREMRSAEGRRVTSHRGHEQQSVGNPHATEGPPEDARQRVAQAVRRHALGMAEREHLALGRGRRGRSHDAARDVVDVNERVSRRGIAGHLERDAPAGQAEEGQRGAIRWTVDRPRAQDRPGKVA